MRRMTLASLALLLSGAPAAAETKFQLTGENTTIEFTGHKADGKHDGGFKELKGTLVVEGTDLTTAAFDLVIDTNSLHSDNPKLTAHLKSPDFFGVRKNPTARFVSRKVEKTEDGYRVTGDLTLCGTTKSISFPAKMSLTGGTFTLSSAFRINRADFGMTYGEGRVNNEVDLRVKVSAKR